MKTFYKYTLSLIVLLLMGYVGLAQVGALPASPSLIQDAPSDYNQRSSIVFDYGGHTISKGRGYFNSLGKREQQYSWDVLTNKVWASFTLYDRMGRPALTTLSAPFSGSNASYLGYHSGFILDSGGNPYTISDFDYNTSSPSTVGTGSFLRRYYNTTNTTNPYQDITAYPFVRQVYSKLNPGQVLKVLGGNKIDGEWKQSYRFTMKAGTELSSSLAFGSGYTTGKKINKTVSRDVNGVDIVVFADADGNMLSTARSGNEEGGVTPYGNTLYIERQQGYVDIHIPHGVSSFRVSSYDNDSGGLRVYNLITEQTVGSVITGNTTRTVPSGFYRISVINPISYAEQDFSPIRIYHKVNYYDYSLNSYDIAGRLTSSKQPHDHLESIFTYNTLGQLQHTESPDEGEADFIYRNDGQIRFSQNSKQAAAGEFSYTNYDAQARPIESGVYSEGGGVAFSMLTGSFPANSLVASQKSELQHTLYDVNGKLEDELSPCHIPADKYQQHFLAGNVSSTWTSIPGTSQTWYSYDVMGRVEWVVQKIQGLDCVKTLDYDYDPVTGQVARVDYQRYVPEERFIHSYRYNAAGQLIQVETTNRIGTHVQADYSYNENGELARTNLAKGLQGIDYVYNLNGQLKAINHPSLKPDLDPGKDGLNGVIADVFGMSLDYYNGDYQRPDTPTPVAQVNSTGIDQYNGNIKGMRFNTQNFNAPSGQFNSYVYSYNKNNWLAGATFGSGTISAISGKRFQVSFQDNPNNDYKVSGITYDENGNLQTLKRNGYTSSSGNNSMDNFQYAYYPGTNQLSNVEDPGDNVNPHRFNDLKSQKGRNYIYNSIGQLVSNINEEISYEYYASGLVKQVNKKELPLLKLFYNDRGQRLRKEVYHQGVLQKQTYYVRDAAGSVMAIYDRVPGHEEELIEQPVYGLSRLGVYKTPYKRYVYEIKDHLGNVRAVVTRQGNNALALTAQTDYYPFGMPMPNRNVEGDYRYKFQGEEKDPETGMEAFELRLWDSRIGRWLTTDPMGEFHSPYLGIGNNPVNKIDPDGGSTASPQDDYKLNKDGTLTLTADTDFADRIFNEGGDFVQLEYDGQIKIDEQGKLSSFLEFKDINLSTEVFEFVSFYSEVEWSQVIDNNVKGFVGSSYQKEHTRVGGEILSDLINSGRRGTFIRRHSHPRDEATLLKAAAGFVRFDQTPSEGDIASAESFANEINKAGITNIDIKNQVYDAVYGGYYNYNHRGFAKPINIKPQGITPFNIKF